MHNLHQNIMLNVFFDMTFHNSARIHALDYLRSSMMLLGLILHAALTYNVTQHGDGWLLKDPKSTHILTDFVVLLIHSFRMPLFFLVSGFLGSMLFYEKGPLPMLKNRTNRIVIPFVVFLLIFSPLFYHAFGYTMAIFSQNEYHFSHLYSDSLFYIPKTTYHLWFLYYLIFFSLTASVLGFIFTKCSKLSKHLKSSFSWIIQRPLVRIVFFTILTILLLATLGTSMVDASLSFTPDRNTFLYFFYFYILGWLLYKTKQHLETLKQYAWISIIIAFLLIVLKGLYIQTSGIPPKSDTVTLLFISSASINLLIFGLLGLSLRYGSQYSHRVKYISEASYWVYLIHLPIVAFVPALICQWPVHAILKFLIVFITTTTCSFASYHFLVKDSLVGRFLIGKIG